MTILSPTSRTLVRLGSAARSARPQASPHVAPCSAPPTVAELSARLFNAYTVEGGHVRLAGCTIEPQPIIHAGGISGSNAIELFLLQGGSVIDAQTVDELGLRDTLPVDRMLRVNPQAAEQMIALGRKAVAEEARQRGYKVDSATSFVKIVWTCWAAGKLRFTIGGKFVELPFADWASRLKAPAWVCPHSGRSTFHLSAVDDGRIVAAEEIATCQESGRRMLKNDLVACNVTGRQVARELTEMCSATRRPVLASQMTSCPTCLLRVSPAALVDGGCRACEKPAPVRKSDPRMCLVLGEHPGLDRWRRWQLAETPQAYVLVARRLVRRLLLVVDKHSLQATRLAERSCFRSSWLDLPAKQWREYLQ